MSKREVYAQLLNTEQRVEGRRAELGVNIHHTNYTLHPSGGHGGAPSSSNASRATRLLMLADAPRSSSSSRATPRCCSPSRDTCLL
jgi:hypothetical protein